MEPAKSPLKQKRPAYKPMWEQAERELKAVRALSHDIEAKAVAYAHKLATAESDLLTLDTDCRRWATAAVIEAMALVIVAIILLAR